MKKILIILSSVVFLVLLGVYFDFKLDSASLLNNSTEYKGVVEQTNDTAKTHEDSDDYFWNVEDEVTVYLSSEEIQSGSSSVLVSNKVVTITKSGTYRLSGSLSDGQIVVDTEDQGTVRLVLSNLDLTSLTSSPFFIKKAEKVVIISSKGTENYISDAINYIEQDDDGEPNATIFSTADLSIYGQENSSLTIKGNYNDAINSKDGLIIDNSKIFIEAKDDGIRGKDYILVYNSNINIVNGGDAIKSDNEDDDDKGFIKINNSEIDIKSEQDGIFAKNVLEISGGNINIQTGDSSTSKLNSEISQKGLKSNSSILLAGNVGLNIDSVDDSIHCNGSIYIVSGNITLSSADDGIHADSAIQIDGGDILIKKSYEGIESMLVAINGGNIDLTSSDDGINISGGNDGSSMNGRPGANDFSALEGAYLYINGGYLHLNSNGDGLDSNGSILMNGGVVIVDGPVANNNGALDCNGELIVNGGYLLAVGSSGMAEAPDENSGQNSVIVNFSSSQLAGTAINIKDSNGNDLVNYAPLKQFQSVVFSSFDLKQDEVYSVNLGGVCDIQSDGNSFSLVNDCTEGVSYTDLTISGVVTSYGQTFGSMGGGGRPGGMSDRSNRELNSFDN